MLLSSAEHVTTRCHQIKDTARTSLARRYAHLASLALASIIITHLHKIKPSPPMNPAIDRVLIFRPGASFRSLLAGYKSIRLIFEWPLLLKFGQDLPCLLSDSVLLVDEFRVRYDCSVASRQQKKASQRFQSSAMNIYIPGRGIYRILFSRERIFIT